jgi:hypothetical protein
MPALPSNSQFVSLIRRHVGSTIENSECRRHTSPLGPRRKITQSSPVAQIFRDQPDKQLADRLFLGCRSLGLFETLVGNTQRNSALGRLTRRHAALVSSPSWPNAGLA